MRDGDLQGGRAALQLRPVEPGERIPALDVLRGLALFGVLPTYALWSLGNAPAETYSQAERVLDLKLSALVDTKAYTMFAFLFGLGFSIQLTSARARGTSIVRVYTRRLLALLLIGLAHALLLRNGDILVPYAVMGFVLLLFRNASNRTLVVGAVIGLLTPGLARGVWEWTCVPFPQRPETEGMSLIASNYAWVRYWYATAVTNWPSCLPMFLCGLYMERRRFFEEPTAHRKGLRSILVAGLSVGALVYLLRLYIFLTGPSAAPGFWRGLVLWVLWYIHAWGTAAFYASALLLLYERPSWRQWLAPLGFVGRMALTNYLLQSILIVPVCIAFDPFDKVTPGLGLLLALAVWTVQVPLSVWWLKHFRFGPAEWVWRSLTYGSPQPMRASHQLLATAADY